MRRPKRTALASLLVLVALCLSIAAVGADASVAKAPPQQAKAFHKQVVSLITGEEAFKHLAALSVGIHNAYGPRLAASASERAAAQYILGAFAEMGYEAKLQPFTYVRLGQEFSSQNVVAYKRGASNATVIVGAHYDSKPAVSTGAGDNASGVGVMLEVAKMLARYRTHANVVFVAFGAEEVGLRGARHYAASMSEGEVAGTVAMVNMDMVGIGLPFNVYCGLEHEGWWVRDLALRIGTRMGHDIRTRPGCTHEAPTEWCDGMPAGTTGDWSDHAPFRLRGIPVAYFEWWYWDEDPCWGTERPDGTTLYHTVLDTIAEIGVWKLEATGEVVAALVYELARAPLPGSLHGVLPRADRYVSVGGEMSVVR